MVRSGYGSTTRPSRSSAICAGRVKVSATLFSGWRRMLPRSADPARKTKAPALRTSGVGLCRFSSAED
jgi:hypothetical protein